MTDLNEQCSNERTIAQLNRLPWTKGLSEAALEDIASAGDYVQFQEGDVVHRADEELTAVFFVVSGRLLATVMDLFGNQVLEKSLTRRSVFGLFSISQPDQANTNLVANEPTTGVGWELNHSRLAR